VNKRRERGAFSARGKRDFSAWGASIEGNVAREASILGKVAGLRLKGGGGGPGCPRGGVGGKQLYFQGSAKEFTVPWQDIKKGEKKKRGIFSAI